MGPDWLAWSDDPREFQMSLAPLLNAAPAIPLHAFAAMAAFALGVVQLAAPKGTLPHRTIGWIWVGLMATVAASSLWIHEIRLFGPWSPIHLLSIYVLIMTCDAASRPAAMNSVKVDRRTPPLATLASNRSALLRNAEATVKLVPTGVLSS